MVMVELLLKIETTGLNKDTDKLIQILLVDLSGNIIFSKTFAADNKAILYNNLSNEVLSKCLILNKEDLESEVNEIVKFCKLYSFNKEFDNNFINLQPAEWVDILELLPKRKRIPDKDCFKAIPSPIYRKALNILNLMEEFSLIDTKETISLNF